MALFIYTADGEHIQRTEWVEGAPIPPRAVWLDLLSPTLAEEEMAEAYVGLEIPTREEMREIEISNRLYIESGHIFMTATLMSNFDVAQPENHAVTFILSPQHLITVRYVDPAPFRIYPQRLMKTAEPMDAHHVFAGLLEAIINRAADILETITLRAEKIAKDIFVLNAPSDGSNHHDILVKIGQCGDVASKVNESLSTLWRLTTYAQQNSKLCTPELQAMLQAHGKDIAALSDHSAFISNKVSFLLDATLGMINIRQNNIIKIFSIAAVVFLPPTLVASIYGMNFRHMPELNWEYGYPMALALMVVAAIVPIMIFRRKKWL